jgi:hypothetical protein
MDDILARFFQDMGDRFTGPMWFRIILQPSVAAFLAIKHGLNDARTGRPLYFWTILTDPSSRRRRLIEGGKAVGKVFCLAVILDVVYQYIVLRWIYPFETLFVAFMLAGVPYLLLRGPANRLFRGRKAPSPTVRP